MISLIAKRQPARRATKVDPVEQAPEFAVGFPKLRDAAQSQASGALRFFRSHPAVDVFLNQQREMSPKLLLEVLIDTSPCHQPANS
jgi:hypothetical protein